MQIAHTPTPTWSGLECRVQVPLFYEEYGPYQGSYLGFHSKLGVVAVVAARNLPKASLRLKNLKARVLDF